MGKRKKSDKVSNSTTIQVKKDLKDELDLLKVMGNFEDLNSLLAELKNFYVDNKKITINPKLENFIKRIKK